MRVLLTGGGTAGHIVPNLAIAEALGEVTKEPLQFLYIGSKQGLERELVEEAGLPYTFVSTGKWRRYFDLKNFSDLFRVIRGVFQALYKIRHFKPDVVFSKGGFVALPVVIAAWLCRVPIVIHESDLRPGLSTRLCAPLARHILVGFPQSVDYLKKHEKKIHVMGTPVKNDLFSGSKEKALKITGFAGEHPVLLVMGGSTGSQELNERVQEERAALCEVFDVIHLMGKGKGKAVQEPHYYSTEYAAEEFKDFYALADMAFSRAGAGSLADLIALKLPAILAPLGLHASRGDQIENAKLAVQNHTFLKLFDEKKSLLSQLKELPSRGSKTEHSHAAKDIAKFLLTIPASRSGLKPKEA